MNELDARMFRTFGEELEKVALVGGLIRGAGNFLKRQGGAAGAGAALGGAAGGALGGVGGGIKGYREAKQRGESGTAAAIGSVGGALSGALKGGMIGAGAGTLAGAAGGTRAAELASSLAKKKGAVGGLSRFGQRQMHSVTGYASPEQLRAIGGGSAQAQKRLAAATTDKSRALARKGLDYAQKSEEMGLTSVPGFVKGLAGRAKYKGKSVSSLEALKTGLGEQWHGSGMGGKAMMAAFPASGLVGAATGPKETEEGGRITRGLKGVASGLAYATPMGMAGQTLLAGGLEKTISGLSRAGSSAGRRVAGLRRPEAT